MALVKETPGGPDAYEGIRARFGFEINCGKLRDISGHDCCERFRPVRANLTAAAPPNDDLASMHA